MNKQTALTVRTLIVSLTIGVTISLIGNEIIQSSNSQQPYNYQNNSVPAYDNNYPCEMLGPGWLYYVKPDGSLSPGQHIGRMSLCDTGTNYFFSQVPINQVRK